MAKAIITVFDNDEGNISVESTFEPPACPKDGLSPAQEYAMRLMIGITGCGTRASDEDDDDDW